MEILFSRKALEYKAHGHPESPERIKVIVDYLKEKEFRFTEPKAAKREDIELVHTTSYAEKIERGDFYDPDTPALKNIYEYALLSAGAAIEAMKISLKKGFAFSLMRPPGHHAGREGRALNVSTMGFCYFNNVAIATEKAIREGLVSKVAIVDLDYHHGNGTQEIFLGRRDVLYVSLHAYPAYPGTGKYSEENCRNHPLPLDVSPREYFEVLERALKEVEEFSPEALGVSMGFDTYIYDPVGGLSLREEDFEMIGAELKGLGLPVFVIMEGGYHTKALPACVESFLKPFL